MSYASAVADHGPKQTEAEKAAPQQVEIKSSSTHHTSAGAGDEVHGHIDVISREAADERDRLSQAAGRAASKAESEAASLKEDAKRAGDSAKAESRKVFKKADGIARRALKDGRTFNVIDAVVLSALGYAGYRRYKENRLGWQDVGLATLGLGVFAGVQNYLQAWFRKNL